MKPMAGTYDVDACVLNISSNKFVSHTFTIKLNIVAKRNIALLEIYVEHNIQQSYSELYNPYGRVYQH